MDPNQGNNQNQEESSRRGSLSQGLDFVNNIPREGLRNPFGKTGSRTGVSTGKFAGQIVKTVGQVAVRIPHVWIIIGVIAAIFLITFLIVFLVGKDRYSNQQSVATTIPAEP